MKDFLNVLTCCFLLLGGLFFFAGTVGLLRFSDVHSRLHALSKADNVGLGFIALGLTLQAESFAVGLKILVIWLLALLASAFTCFLVADWETSRGRHRNL